jgi:uncharacterized membrane protein YjjP (DUF1212 family)
MYSFDDRRRDGSLTGPSCTPCILVKSIPSNIPIATIMTRKSKEKVDREAVQFVLKLGHALHQYGTPAHRLEDMLIKVSERLGLEGQFFSTPTAIMAAFGELGSQQNALIRVEPGVVDLGRLVEVDAVANQVVRGELSPVRGSEILDAIEESSHRRQAMLHWLCFGVASAAGSTFFGGGIRELVVAAAIGLVIGLFSLWSEDSETLKRVFVPVSSVVASFLAVLASHHIEYLSVYIPMVAGLIWILPGLTLTTALTELGTRNLASGSARLTLAMMIFLEMAFGVALGLHLGGVVTGGYSNVSPIGFPWWSQWVALFFAAASFTILLRARLRDMGLVAVMAVVAFGGARLGAQVLGVELGAFIGALLVGIGSNVFARLANRPAAVLMVPGIILLVPGSIGFRSVSLMLDNDVLTGMETAFTVGLIGASLVAGLLLANLVITPRKAL